MFLVGIVVGYTRVRLLRNEYIVRLYLYSCKSAARGTQIYRLFILSDERSSEERFMSSEIPMKRKKHHGMKEKHVFHVITVFHYVPTRSTVNTRLARLSSELAFVVAAPKLDDGIINERAALRYDNVSIRSFCE